MGYHEEPIPGEFPMFESLKLTIGRTLPYWDNVIVPQIKQGKQILIAAHGNSLRGVVKHLDQISDDDIMSLNLPTGIPFVYELDENMEAVANQGKAKKVESAPVTAEAKELEPKKSEEVEKKSQGSNAKAEGSETKAEGCETKAEGNETKAEEKCSEGTPESAAASPTEPAAEVKSPELINGEQ